MLRTMWSELNSTTLAAERKEVRLLEEMKGVPGLRAEFRGLAAELEDCEDKSRGKFLDDKN